MNYSRFALSLSGISLAIALVSCGGGGSGTATTTASPAATVASGVFYDSKTSGLQYVSGGQSGTTDANGNFTYEVGKPVTFSIGGVTIGTLTISGNNAVVTPVDLVSSGTVSTQAVQNIARFLMMLDTDGNPSNGITISPAVSSALSNLNISTFDVSEATFAANVAPLVAAANAADSGTRTLPTAAVAQAHITAGLRCVRAGGYRGTYNGTDTGNFGFLVNANNGNVTGVAYSNGSQSSLTLAGTTASALDQSGAFASGITSTGASFNGTFNSSNSIVGSWSSSSGSGGFSGSRIGGAINSKYRYTGSFAGYSNGLFTFDISTSGAVSGYAYTPQSDTLTTLSGTLTGTTLAVMTGDGSTASATLDVTAGTISAGTWSHGAANGTFTGSGCTLN